MILQYSIMCGKTIVRFLLESKTIQNFFTLKLIQISFYDLRIFNLRAVFNRTIHCCKSRDRCNSMMHMQSFAVFCKPNITYNNSQLLQNIGHILTYGLPDHNVMNEDNLLDFVEFYSKRYQTSPTIADRSKNYSVISIVRYWKL